MLEKQINQMKQLKTDGHLNTKDQDQIESIRCFYVEKIRQKNNKQNKK